MWRYFYEAEETVEQEGRFEIGTRLGAAAEAVFIKLLGFLCFLAQARVEF